jgi:hypothetical protein
MRHRLLIVEICLLFFSPFSLSQVAKHSGGDSNVALPDRGLMLSLALDTSPTKPPLVGTGTAGVMNPCLLWNPLLACIPLVLTLSNRGTQAIRIGMMTCGRSQFSFEFPNKNGTWRELPPDPLKASGCLWTRMEWHTIPPGQGYTVDVKIADQYWLETQSLRNAEERPVRVEWKVCGCPAAITPAPHSNSALPPPGVNLLLWRAQCKPGTTPQKSYAQLVSNPIVLKRSNELEGQR